MGGHKIIVALNVTVTRYQLHELVMKIISWKIRVMV
jgi:hypothetical protein